MESLCEKCSNVREVVSGTGSRFLLCRLSQADNRFAKYPPQPVVRCDGYESGQSAQSAFTMKVLPETFAVCRLSPDQPIPDWASGELLSSTRTPEELSIVCLQANVPSGIRAQRGWRCLRVVGTLDFSLVGVIASLTAPLASGGISVFVMSTFDTDYLLVKESDLESAVAALAAAGHTCQVDGE